MANEMLRVLNDLDMVGIEIETALDALTVYDDAMEEDLPNIDPNKSCTVELFLQSQKLNNAVLQLCRDSLWRSLQEMHKLVDAGIALDKADNADCKLEEGGA